MVNRKLQKISYTIVAVIGTFVLALIGVHAPALAPMIMDLPSPIIGGSIGPTQSTRFVYPDAFNLDYIVYDDTTTATLLRWSYEIVGTPAYLINGVDPINSGAVDPVTVGDSSTINHYPGGMGRKNGVAEDNPDGKVSTISIRNQHLSPLGAAPVENPPTGWIDTQPVTFWCSDGDKASSTTVMFYTDNNAGGWNRLSSRPPT